MLVMKFGGTSVADAERMLGAASLVSDSGERRPVVVVSALGGVTDLLFQGAQAALEGDRSAYETRIQELNRRHEEAGRRLARGRGAERAEEDWESLRSDLSSILDRLAETYRGISLLGELSLRTQDLVAGTGEILSSRLMANACRAQGLDAVWVDPREWLLTNNDFGRAQPLWEQVRERVSMLLRPVTERGAVPVTGGYVGATAEGIPTTLGRGGSDYSAAILGVCLGVEEIQIWTDVDGMMTADPRLVPDARLLEEVGFAEAAELAYFGAKVLHPSTIKPAMEADIPVRVLNTLKPEIPGTRITAAGRPGETGETIETGEIIETGETIRAIAVKKGITGITITSARMLMAHGFLSSVFQVFDRHRTAIDLVATSEVSLSLTVDDTRNLDGICRDLEAFSQVEVHSELAVVAVVGQNFLRQREVAGRIFSALRQVNILMISFGASDINLSFVVKEADADRTLRLLHRELLALSPTEGSV